MDEATWVNIGLVLLFVLVGGVFAGTELALVSLRDSQLGRLERQGRRGARVAAVARDPNTFLAAVQIGVTVAGFFSAAYGASTLAPDFAPALEALGLSEGLARTVSLVALTLVIAYLSLVLGELVPKRLALQRAASVALVVGPPLDRFARLMRPVIWLLSVSTNAVVRGLGGDPRATSEQMTEEELRDIVGSHEGLAPDERRIIDDVFDAADRSLGEVMRPRGEVAFLPASLDVAEAVAAVRDRPYSRYPVTGEDFDDVVGFLHVRDLLGADPAAPLRSLTRELLHLPSTNRLLPSLSRMRREGVHIAVVVDEYGGTDGIVTLEDLVEELVGDIQDEHDAPVANPARNDDRVTVDASLTIEEFAEETGVPLEDGPYETAAGWVLAQLGRLAVVGDVVPAPGHEIVVVGTRDRRITRLEVRPSVDADAPTQDAADEAGHDRSTR
ncbi:hemolysin family protein [Cellulomonas carbonis]|uniref:Membrane protein n=1 Tax=Cellulomonas carbonis T26 TaxID=947969 RepID=A0A0A0BLY1_9CELL|nr:hemolysin family protein [Cellulomonas carbonis]KGM09528.1 membrane protein [Cellulomonas carbonis T26]GGB95604.1 membrane protein [Cellulomonas carbonis]